MLDREARHSVFFGYIKYSVAVFASAAGLSEASRVKQHRRLSAGKNTFSLARSVSVSVQNKVCVLLCRGGYYQGVVALYAELMKKYSIDIVASGGVSSISDIRALKEIGIYAAIIGKAYYTGAINLKEALEVAK